MRTLFVLALLSGVAFACNSDKCTAGDRTAYTHCGVDAGPSRSGDCSTDQYCAALVPSANDRRCLTPCVHTVCPGPNQYCQPIPVGDACGNEFTDPDAGPDGGVPDAGTCTTVFVCMPNSCQ